MGGRAPAVGGGPVVRRAGAAQGGDPVRRDVVDGVAAAGVAAAGVAAAGVAAAGVAAAGRRGRRDRGARGWLLRALAGLLAVASLAVGYPGVSLWVLPDVAVRGTELAHLSVMSLGGSERRYLGAGITVASAALTLIAAVLLMRSASDPKSARSSAMKYGTPATRRSITRRNAADGAMLEQPETPEMSERMIWDALDEGRDPTDRPSGSDTEGR
nr:TIGR02234 family membrane protein [Mycobacterium lepraemurium]